MIWKSLRGAAELELWADSLKTSRRFPFFADVIKALLVKVAFLQAEGAGLLARVDLGIYSKTALMKVVHRFSDRCFVHLQEESDAVVAVRFTQKAPDGNLDSLAGEFCNELLDQTLREIVARESEPTRNLVIAHALSRTSLVNSDVNDPRA